MYIAFVLRRNGVWNKKVGVNKEGVNEKDIPIRNEELA
jgi:hypothetical protein